MRFLCNIFFFYNVNLEEIGKSQKFSKNKRQFFNFDCGKIISILAYFEKVGHPWCNPYTLRLTLALWISWPSSTRVAYWEFRPPYFITSKIFEISNAFLFFVEILSLAISKHRQIFNSPKNGHFEGFSHLHFKFEILAEEKITSNRCKRLFKCV